MAFLASYINLLIKNNNSINCTEIHQILCYARQIQVLNGFLSQHNSLLESCFSKTAGIYYLGEDRQNGQILVLFSDFWQGLLRYIR